MFNIMLRDENLIVHFNIYSQSHWLSQIILEFLAV